MHIDPDLLALMALGETIASPADLDHLEGCEACADELLVLRRTASVGRSTLGAGELAEPAPGVWSRITQELQPDATVAPLDTGRPARWRSAVTVAAAAVLLAAGGVVTWTVLRPAPATVLAAATLDAFPEWAGATGTAVVEEGAGGERVLRLSVTDLDGDESYRELWLISSDGSRLVSLGVVSGSGGTFPIPDEIDLSRYDIVDVSDEPLDGDPAHSGDSIVRGKLS